MDKKFLEKVSKMNVMALMSLAKEMDENFDITTGNLKRIQVLLYKDLIGDGLIEKNAKLFDYYIKSFPKDHYLFSIEITDDENS